MSTPAPDLATLLATRPPMLDRLAPGVRVVTPPGHRLEIGSRGPFGERFPMLPDRKENLSRLMGRGEGADACWRSSP